MLAKKRGKIRLDAHRVHEAIPNRAPNFRGSIHKKAAGRDLPFRYRLTQRAYGNTGTVGYRERIR